MDDGVSFTVKALSSSRHGGHHVRVLRGHFDRLLHHLDRVDRRPVRCDLLPHGHHEEALAQVLLPLPLVLLRLPLQIQRTVLRAGSADYVAVHTGEKVKAEA